MTISIGQSNNYQRAMITDNMGQRIPIYVRQITGIRGQKSDWHWFTDEDGESVGIHAPTKKLAIQEARASLNEFTLLPSPTRRARGERNGLGDLLSI